MALCLCSWTKYALIPPISLHQLKPVLVALWWSPFRPIKKTNEKTILVKFTGWTKMKRGFIGV